MGYIRGEHSVSAFASAALVFLIVWWAWSQFTWLGNAIDLDERWNRLAVLIATGSAFFMAKGVADAFDEGAQWFTVSYGVTMAIGLGLYWRGVRGDRELQKALGAYTSIAAPAVLILVAAGFVNSDYRTWVYLLAIAGFVMSGVTASNRAAFRIAPAHFAERHSLIVIIALGESMIAVGVAATGIENSRLAITAIVFGVIGALALWWAYFDWFADKTEGYLRRRPDERQAAFARDAYTYGHYPMVYGIVAYAVAVEEAVAHPEEALDAAGRFGLGAGLGLYLLATVVVHRRSGGSILVERVVAAIVMATIAAFASDLDGVVALILVVIVLVAAMALDRYRHRSTLLADVASNQ